MNPYQLFVRTQTTRHELLLVVLSDSEGSIHVREDTGRAVRMRVVSSLPLRMTNILVCGGNPSFLQQPINY